MTNFSEAAAKENKGQSKELAEALAKAAAAKDKFAFVELAGIFSPYISTLARSFQLPESAASSFLRFRKQSLTFCLTDKIIKASFWPLLHFNMRNLKTFLKQQPKKAKIRSF